MDLELIKKDETFIITAGEYEDYNIHGLHKALKDFHMIELKEEYKNKYPQIGYYYYFNYEKFVKWIVEIKKISKPINYKECYIGD